MNKGQSFLETSMLFICMAVAIFIMAKYVKRASEGRVYSLLKDGVGSGLYNELTATMNVVKIRNVVIDTRLEEQDNETVLIENTTSEYNEYQRVTSSL